MNYNNIKKYISAQRLRRYESVCNHDPKRALKLYQTNLRLSQAFYPLLSLFEVILRNAINNEMVNYLGDQDWLRNQRNNLVYRGRNYQGRNVTNSYLKDKISKVIRHNPQASNGKIVSELSFGFWTDLFELKYFPLVYGRPMHIFHSLPPNTNRANISRRLKSIRDFRNRIYHNEPIIFLYDNGVESFNIDCCEEIYKELKSFFQYFNLDFKGWTRRIDNVLFEIERASFVHTLYPKGNYYTKRILIGLKHYKKKYI